MVQEVGHLHRGRPAAEVIQVSLGESQDIDDIGDVLGAAGVKLVEDQILGAVL